MKDGRTIAVAALCLIVLGGRAGEGHAQSLSDYTAYPPFTATTAVPPNILLLLDNSGSMNTKAYQTAFDPTRVYYGLFDPLECYTYGSNKFQPDSAANPDAPGTCGVLYPWSGNLLNYVSMRRIDISKWVMMGGICSVGGRDAQGNCRQLMGQNSFGSTCCLDQTQSITVAQASGRMPLTSIPTSGNVYFHMMGSVNSLKGSFCVDDDSGQPGGSSCSDNDGYLESNWQIRVDLLQNASGIIQEVGSKARFGLMEFKGSGDGGKVLSDVGGNVTSMITAIESTTPSTWTPLAESLYEATRYFAQVQPAYTSSDYSYNVTNRDPYYFQQPDWASTSQYVPCCKSFVIIFTDGQPTQDLNIPATLRDYAHAAGTHGASTHCGTATGCTEPLTAGTGSAPKHSSTSSSVHAGLTDHHDNCSAYYGGPSSDSCVSNGSHYLDDVAYYAHVTDLRQATVPGINLDGSDASGKDLSGVQNLTIYTFLAFGSGAKILQDAAKLGAFEDRNGNNIPDLVQEWDRFNNETGAAGADGVPDTYYESSDADRLHDRLLAAITSILQRSASGTSVSVLATSSTGDGSIYQAYFYPLVYEGLNQITWTGYAQGLFLDAFGNVREDTNGDGKLVFNQDHIIRSRLDSSTGDVRVDRYLDDDGDGKADSATPFETVGLRDIVPIWEAGKQLALTASSARKLLTWVDANDDGVVDAGEQITFTVDNAPTLRPYLRAGTAPFTETNIIKFIRGEQVADLRDRQLTVDGNLLVWKLGDPIDSTPTVVAAPKERFDVLYGDESYSEFYLQYKNRRQVVYVGANDGMLHAFNGGFYHRGDDPNTGAVEHGYFTTTPTGNSGDAALGQELWGFIPYQLLPHLRWLAQTDYTHVYYVDLKPKVTDARIFVPDAKHPGGWGTILIGGMRFGGSCGACAASTGGPPMKVRADFGRGVEDRYFYSAYFVLDITDPESDPVLLWSYGAAELGLTTSYPAIVRGNPSGNPKTDNAAAEWFIVVGSGVTGYDGSIAQTGKLFALKMPKPYAPGKPLAVTTFSTGETSFLGNLVALDGDLDFRTDVAYGGSVINHGSGPAWIGKMYRLTTRGGDPASSSWGYQGAPTVLLATFPADGSLFVGPVTAAPTVTRDDANNLWVYFGTGRLYGNNDKTNTDTQHLIGVKDPVLSGSCTESSATNCMAGNLLNVSSASVCVTCATVTQVTGVSGATTFDELTAKVQGSGNIPGMDGWYTALPTAGERMLNSPTILGGAVFFTTFVPSSDLCSSSGTGYLYALFYKTGSAFKESIIGTTQSGKNVVALRSISLGSGLPSQMAVQIGAQGSGGDGSGGAGKGCQGRVMGFVQTSGGGIGQPCATPPSASWSRYISWLNQRT